MFQKLGEAEAAVHDVPLEKVHFHEVGAADSIADIVGACVAFDLLGVDTIVSSPVNVGSGTVKTEHGILPVPAPATARLLSGTPVYARGPAMELTTPTGAAVAVTLSQSFGVLPAVKILRTGYGAGDREFKEQANVLRVILGEPTGAAEATSVTVIEANIDDATPQVLAYAAERLLDSGALDVTLQPLVMKKGRPGSLLRVIATPGAARMPGATGLRRNADSGPPDLYRRAARAGAHLHGSRHAARHSAHQSFRRRRLCPGIRRLP